VLTGHAGMLAMTHAAFYGIGAYATAVLTSIYDFTFIDSILVGAALSFVIAFIIGFAMARVRDEYYALASFGFMVVVFSILNNWVSVTKGSVGITSIPNPEVFGVSLSSDLSVLALVSLTLFFVSSVMFVITRSHFGRVLRAIKDNYKIVELFGYKHVVYMTIIFTLTAILASAVGSLYASYISFVSPASFTLFESIFILTIVIFGGAGSLRGAILGSFVLVSLPEVLRFLDLSIGSIDQFRLVIYGLILITVIYFRPKGILGSHSI
jgi:branched-chain amino acid transport system permease protein